MAPWPNYEPGLGCVAICPDRRGRARVARQRELIAKYDLSAGHEPQKFGIGRKEIWEIDPAKSKPGTVTPSHGLAPRQKCRRRRFIYHL